MPRKKREPQTWPDTAPRNWFQYRFPQSKTYYGPVKAHNEDHVKARLRRWWQSLPEGVIIEPVKRPTI